MSSVIGIIGKVPPPIGGVTIHVSRLIQLLEKEKIEYSYFDLSKNPKRGLFAFILNNKVIHLHTSSVYLRLLISLMCFVCFKKLIVTFHGNLGRYDFFGNLIDKLTVFFSRYPIVLNQGSYQIARKINPRATVISAFIPAQKIHNLEQDIVESIRELKERRILFCTNAFNVTFDKKGEEIYQISKLIDMVGNHGHVALVISDPSSNYQSYIQSIRATLPPNVLFLSFPHDFNAVLLEVDCFIRYTTTDGDSLSIKEALILGKQVIASNVVDRPKGVILVKNTDELEDAIISIDEKRIEINDFEDSGVENLINLYKRS